MMPWNEATRLLLHPTTRPRREVGGRRFAPSLLQGGLLRMGREATSLASLRFGFDEADAEAKGKRLFLPGIWRR